MHTALSAALVLLKRINKALEAVDASKKANNIIKLKLIINPTIVPKRSINKAK